jgi:hypothetical protein
MRSWASAVDHGARPSVFQQDTCEHHTFVNIVGQDDQPACSNTPSQCSAPINRKASLLLHDPVVPGRTTRPPALFVYFCIGTLLSHFALLQYSPHHHHITQRDTQPETHRHKNRYTDTQTQTHTRCINLSGAKFPSLLDQWQTCSHQPVGQRLSWKYCSRWAWKSCRRPPRCCRLEGV